MGTSNVTSPITKTGKITRQRTGTRPGTGTGPGIGKGHTQWKGTPRMEGHHLSVRPGEQPVIRTARSRHIDILVCMTARTGSLYIYNTKYLAKIFPSKKKCRINVSH